MYGVLRNERKTLTGRKLVIVESPAKAKTIAQYLGDGYDVLASVGHIRDLADTKSLPPELKKQGSIGKFSIDVDNGFQPYYVLSDRAAKTVPELKRSLKDADELFLATDEDREGEAIAWHLLEVLKPKVPVKRMVFHEITKDAIQGALENTREIDRGLVDAQETRRIMDRIFGFEVSPVLWRKVATGLSAGRVQSPAVRLIVQREWERRAFVSASYWDVTATLQPGFDADLIRIDGARIAEGKDFDDTGQLKNSARVVAEAEAVALAGLLGAAGTEFLVDKVESKPGTRRPAVPFTTSTLQQEAGRKLRLTARDTMSVAQSLYENGYITYMRTDSVSLSDQAIVAARAQASALYGPATIPEQPRRYAAKSKNAQEAHEAIRPSGESWQTPAQLAGHLRGRELDLYDLIWKRTVASQMIDAQVSTTTITLSADAAGQKAEFTASGTVVLVPGFRLAYEEGKDEAGDEAAERTLPDVKAGDQLAVIAVDAKGHETTPPPRFTEATLVKKLEELGIGRPSTYASIIDTITSRYVEKSGQALVPKWIAFPVISLLEKEFGEFVDYQYTAELEEDLDRIAAGNLGRVDWLSRFYFGDSEHEGLRETVAAVGEVDPRELSSLKLSDDVTVRVGRYGPYIEVDEGGDKPRRVNIPDSLQPDQLSVEKARELIAAPIVTDRVLGTDPATGREIVVKDGRYGTYVSEIIPEESAPAEEAKSKKKTAVVKPRTASLFKDMTVDGVDLETALRLLSLPRVVGADPQTGEEITAQNGRYGPYLKKGVDSRSLQSEQQLFDITLEEALAIYAEPKQFGRRAAASALKEFDADPVSGKPIRLRDGRFGPYVTDGDTNATVPRGEDPETVDFERAVQLLADKRAKGPAKKPARTAPGKRTTAKKA